MTWLRIGTAGDFPTGSLRIVHLLGRAVGIRREADGTLFALELACRHQGGDLSAGKREGTLVTCPRHGWRYDLATGACLTDPALPLRPLRVNEADGEVRIDPAPEPLS